MGVIRTEHPFAWLVAAWRFVVRRRLFAMYCFTALYLLILMRWAHPRDFIERASACLVICVAAELLSRAARRAEQSGSFATLRVLRAANAVAWVLFAEVVGGLGRDRAYLIAFAVTAAAAALFEAWRLRRPSDRHAQGAA